MVPFAAIQHVPPLARVIGLAEPLSMHKDGVYWVTPGVTYRIAVAERNSENDMLRVVLESCKGVRIETAERTITDLGEGTIFSLDSQRKAESVMGPRLTCKKPLTVLYERLAHNWVLWNRKLGSLPG
jgi:hypothetical protein